MTKNYKNCDKQKWTKQTISEETFWGEKTLQNIVTKIYQTKTVDKKIARIAEKSQKLLLLKK